MLDERIITDFENLEIVPLLNKDLKKIWKKVEEEAQGTNWFNLSYGDKRIIYYEITWNEDDLKLKYKFEIEAFVNGKSTQKCQYLMDGPRSFS